MMFDFTNRTLVLTGANGGIGRAVAELFHAAGANLVLADLDDDALAKFAATLTSPRGGKVETLAVDAANPDDADRLIAVAAKLGGIDCLVPSAGIYMAEPFSEMTDAQWRRTLSINLDGVFYLTRRAVEHLKAGSSIVNLSSLAAHRGAKINAHYGASKGAISAMTRALANELAPKTRVNVVAPGVIDTPMTRELIAIRGDDTLRQTPMGRTGKASEIATVIAFLCSEAASFVNGETLHVNGGLYMS
ncbi:SDR family NAD(P)-dependent oxidoreductase [Celeribacter halophilus]|uniref:3-oxoacyl-[acyl-carrier protein] reductase n=1 Tax=Celeribacter halophilus TaxID=576117 RepID=A0A1I3WUW8_9RHOB|nr:SDR family NAD(P)-dependent oxidoreductase [Celeribacter halophilus]PZX06015.1 3-oxoacyl-[acyl-carrier protein] reductase [Celeribacter halophilus]SFK10251.1 3-oxoacyl-[acyl-carrier protein] reductase [Celeribacter halophilus]